MENQTHARFLAANQELRDFLRRVVSLANGTGKATEVDLEKISLRLMNLGPEVGDASRSEKKARGVMPARRARLESKKRRTDGLQSWFDVLGQIT